MKSKTSFFSVSPAVIREDFRRFWAIPVFAFVGYFLFGLLPIMINYSFIKKDGGENAMIVGNYVDSLLSGQNPFVLMNSLWVPLLAGLLIFSYLHRTGSVMSVHSQPLTRNTLFNSHFISSLLFCIGPVLLTGLILLIIAQPIHNPHVSAEYDIDLFSRSRILLWMWDYCLSSFFVLAIVVFGGMITGTSVHHFIAAVGFNAVTPALYLILKAYYSMYLFGYNDMSLSVLQNLSPVIHSVSYTPIGLKWSVIYLIIAIIIIGFSMFLYNKRRLERATDGVVFKTANVLITLLFGFLGMSLLGFVFHDIFDESKAMTAFGYICGALLAMMIVRMIIMKTIRIFDRSFFKTLAAYLVTAVIFFVVIVFDLTGFESRVPDSQKIDQVRVNDQMLYELLISSESGDYQFSQPETIELITQLHKEITENKEYCESFRQRQNTNTRYIEFRYSTGDRNDGDYKETMSRSYSVPASLLDESEAYRKLLVSDEVKKLRQQSLALSAGNAEAEIMSGLLMPNSEFGKYSDVSTEDKAEAVPGISMSKADAAAFYEVYRQEMLSYDADTLMKRYYKPNYVDFVLYLNVQKEGSASPSAETKIFSLKISDTVILNWLREKGYLGSLEKESRFAYQKAVIETTEMTDYGLTSRLTEEGSASLPEAGEGITVVTDTAQVRALYENALNGYAAEIIDDSNYSDYCYVRFYTDDAAEHFVGLIRRGDIPKGIAAPVK